MSEEVFIVLCAKKQWMLSVQSLAVHAFMHKLPTERWNGIPYYTYREDKTSLIKAIPARTDFTQPKHKHTLVKAFEYHIFGRICSVYRKRTEWNQTRLGARSEFPLATWFQLFFFFHVGNQFETWIYQMPYDMLVKRRFHYVSLWAKISLFSPGMTL